ncbi:MAG TPA: Gfo/Idh/MocA family oxidoreductase [Chloroflexota bacterium]|nr:Gfo/Idh/MocA family oxidoreductase [Chloroflexota bacterium]
MIDQPVGWAFLGAGRHARLWLAPALQGASGARAVGVWSRDPNHGAEFAATYGVERVFASLEDALADPDVETCLISTPNALHAAHALAALRAGKHVLVEKPMATSPADALALVQAARTAQRQLGVGFHLRHNVVVRAGREHIARGAIGQVQYVSAQFNLVSSPPPRMNIPHAEWKRDPAQMGGAGALMGLGVHVIDLVRFLSGQEVTAVSASATGITPNSPLESFAQVQLQLEGGAHAHIVYGGAFPLSRNDAVIYGSAGRLTLEDVIDVASGGLVELALPGVPAERLQPVVPDHYQAEIEAFQRAVRGQPPFEASGLDGLRNVEIASAIVESQRGGGTLVPVERSGV